MTVNRRAIVSVVIGLALGGCSPTSPTQVPPPHPPPTAKVGLTVSSVTETSIAPDTFMYTVRLQLAESGGVSYTVIQVDLTFDRGYACERITGDALGENRRLTPNGMLDLELACVPENPYAVGNKVSDAYVAVTFIDDNRYPFSAKASINKF